MFHVCVFCSSNRDQLKRKTTAPLLHQAAIHPASAAQSQIGISLQDVFVSELVKHYRKRQFLPVKTQFSVTNNGHRVQFSLVVNRMHQLGNFFAGATFFSYSYSQALPLNQPVMPVFGSLNHPKFVRFIS